MTYEDFLSMNKRQRRSLYRRAERGDRKALKEYARYTNLLKVETNKRLRALIKSRLDYGKFVNNVLYFTQTEYGRNRLLSANELEGDIYSMMVQNEIALKFLNSKQSTVAGAREVEEKRVEALTESGRLPEQFMQSKRRAREFLRWLGNEEVTASMDEYGRSDVVIEIAYDIYSKQGKTGLRTLSRALTEWLSDNRMTFDEAMERIGVKVEDYLDVHGKWW